MQLHLGGFPHLTDNVCFEFVGACGGSLRALGVDHSGVTGHVLEVIAAQVTPSRPPLDPL
eukprot:7968568-Pyramimonas_sp.AAC.1